MEGTILGSQPEIQAGLLHRRWIEQAFDYTDGMFEDVVDELVGLSDRALIERIEANEAERRRLDAEMSALLAVAERRRVKEIDGHRTMVAFCRATTNWSTSEAARRLSAARAVDGVAEFGSRWHAGRFGAPQAALIARTFANPRVRERMAEFAPLLMDHAEQLSYSDLSTVVERFVALADTEGAHDDRDVAVEARSARVVGVGGRLDVSASGGDGLVTAEMVAIFQRFCDAEHRRDLDDLRRRWGDAAEGHDLRRSARQRRFDALVTIFRTAASSGEHAPSVGDPLVNITIDAATWGRLLHESGWSTSTDLDGRAIDPFTGLHVGDADRLLADPDALLRSHCESADGTVIHPHDVLRAALAGHVRRVVIDTDGVVIDMGRRQRLFTRNARHAATHLVRHCRHPGCELPTRWCDVDHVTPWADHGPTDQDNSTVLCSTHNRLKHQRRWRHTRAPDGRLVTRRADGTFILPVGRRPPAPPIDPSPADDDPPPHRRPTDDECIEIARLTTIARRRVRALETHA